MTWSTRLTSVPRGHILLLIGGIALLLAVAMTAGLSPLQQIATLIGIATIGAAVVGFVRSSRSRETHRIQAMLDALPNPTYFKALDGSYSAVNSAWEQFFGIPRSAIVGKTIQQLEPD